MLEPSRRDVLRLGLGLSLLGSGLAACSVSPTIENPRASEAPSTPVSRTSATPTVAAQVPAAAVAEQQLSVYAGAILTGPHRADLDRGTRTLLTFLRDAHARHATALAGANPTTRPTTATPSPTATPPTLRTTSLAASLAGLASAEAAQAVRQRRVALAASGLTALLSGSLAVAAASFSTALKADDPPAVHALGSTQPAPLLSDVAAVQAMVGQLHAIVYGYQLAIGRLTVGSSARSRALTGLAVQRSLLDELIAVLNARSADVPAAEAAYVPSPDPRSPASAQALIAAMETRLTPYAGMLVAAAGTEADRTRALTILSDVDRTARSWGAPLRAWPGWPD